MANFRNFAYGAVLVAPTPAPAGLTLRLLPGQGARFPAVPFQLTIWPQVGMPDPNNAEIGTVTAIVGDDLTLLRGQEGSTPRAIVAGDQVAAPLTKALLDQIPFLGDPTVTWQGSTTILGNATIGGATTLSGTLHGVGAATLDQTLHVLGNTTLDGTLAVQGAVSILSATLQTLHVTGATTLDGALAVSSVVGPVSVAGAVTLLAGLDVKGTTLLESTLTVTSNTTLNGTLGVVGVTTLSSATVTGTLTPTMLDIKAYKETKADLGSVSGTLTINMTLGSVYSFQHTGDISTTTITNVPAAGRVGSFMVRYQGGGSAQPWAWFATVNWPSGVVPGRVATTQYDWYLFATVDGGVKWTGFVMAQNVGA